MDPRSDLTFSQLDSIDHVLDGTSNGLDLLSQSLLLAGMVTEPRYKQMAQRVIALNEAALANRASRGVESTEKLLPRSKDLETSRLTLETRDVLREIAALLTNRSANNAR
jgi:hypothetical protein